MGGLGSLRRDAVRLSGNALARNTGWMMLAQGARLVVQGAYFVLVARALGARQFGAFAAALALVSILAPFAACGTGNLLVMHVARRPAEFARSWGNALVAIPVAGAPLTLLTVGATLVVIPSLPVRLVLALALAEFFFSRVADTAAQAFQALDRMLICALLSLVVNVARLAAAAVFVASVAHPDAAGWARWYLGGTAVAAAAGVAVVTLAVGRPRPARASLGRNLRDGLYFSLAQTSSNIYTDIDKTMLGRLASLQAAGIYAAAYRATAMAFVPVLALLTATYARFFKRGEEGIRGSLDLARGLVPLATAYGVCAGAAVFALAPLAPHVLGPDYAEAVGALRWLAPLPALQALYYIGGDTLTGAGHQAVRSVLQLAAAALNVVLNLWLIPLYSWQGAAVATFASLGALAAGLWLAVALVSRQEDRRRVRGEPSARLAGVQP